MTDALLTKNEVLTAEQLNEHGQVTDRTVLSKERYKFGFANILFQGEESGLIPIHTVIVRALGGSATHIGVSGAISGISSLVQWMAVFLLKKYNSNQKAMYVALWAGAVCAFLMGASTLFAINPALRIYCLWAYLALGLMLSGISGILWNIETSWIGDLVPKQILGWFSSVKFIVGIFGILMFTLFFGKSADLWPYMTTYASFFLVIGISHIIAVLLVSRIIDRVPRNANFIFSGSTHHERLNYRSLPLWCYVSFYVLWASGRTAMLAFMTAYLIDQFHYSMTAIVLILAIQNVIGMILLLVMGKVSDRYGNRMPLLLISGTVSCCMLLWVVSAWWGIIPIIIYQVVNGAAGYVHSMLGINYGIEIFPDKGRAGYFGITRLLTGIMSISTPIIAGRMLRGFEGFHCILLGAEINHYHLFFIVCSLIALSSIIPLLVVGKRVVTVEE